MLETEDFKGFMFLGKGVWHWLTLFIDKLCILDIYSSLKVEKLSKSS